MYLASSTYIQKRLADCYTLRLERSGKLDAKWAGDEIGVLAEARQQNSSEMLDEPRSKIAWTTGGIDSS